MEIKCKQCRKPFKTKKSKVAKGQGIFCSRKCYGKWLSINKKLWGINTLNEEEKEKAWKKASEKKKGKSPWNKGKKLHYMPSNVFKKGQNIADKHPRWKGGLWTWAKKQVLERDNGICQYCGLNEPEIMDTAHIEPVKGNRKRMYEPQDIENLITLCPNCHRRFDMGLIKLQ